MLSSGRKANLTEVDIQGTQALSQAAAQAKVKTVLLSQLILALTALVPTPF